MSFLETTLPFLIILEGKTKYFIQANGKVGAQLIKDFLKIKDQDIIRGESFSKTRFCKPMEWENAEMQLKTNLGKYIRMFFLIPENQGILEIFHIFRKFSSHFS